MPPTRDDVHPHAAAELRSMYGLTRHEGLGSEVRGACPSVVRPRMQPHLRPGASSRWLPPLAPLPGPRGAGGTPHLDGHVCPVRRLL